MMSSWRFYLKTVTGLLVIILSCFLAIGLSVSTEKGGEVLQPKMSPWWAFTIAFAVSMFGLWFIVRACRRSGKSPKWIGYLLFPFAGLLGFAAFGAWLTHDSYGTLIMALLAVLLAPSGWFLIRISRPMAHLRVSTPSQPGTTALPAPAPAPAPRDSEPRSRASRLPPELRGPVSKLLLFVVVLGIDVAVAYVPVIPQGSKATIFTTILVLGCVAVGIVSETTAAKLLKLGKD